jgi:hypothetical protein
VAAIDDFRAAVERLRELGATAPPAS